MAKNQEQKMLADEDILLTVRTEKGSVCMTPKKYDAYIRKLEREQSKSTDAVKKSSDDRL